MERADREVIFKMAWKKESRIRGTRRGSAALKEYSLADIGTI